MAVDSENPLHGDSVVKPIKTWKGYIWDTFEMPEDQRWLLFKLDAFVLTFASVGHPIHAPQSRGSFSPSIDRVFP